MKPGDFTPDPDVATFGWIRVTISPKRQCVTCNRKVYVGIVNIHDQGGKIMCLRCFEALDDEESVVPDDLRGI